MKQTLEQKWNNYEWCKRVTNDLVETIEPVISGSIARTIGTRRMVASIRMPYAPYRITV